MPAMGAARSREALQALAFQPASMSRPVVMMEGLLTSLIRRSALLADQLLRGRAGGGLLGVRDAEHGLGTLAVAGQPGDNILGRRGSNQDLVAAHGDPQADERS